MTNGSEVKADRGWGDFSIAPSVLVYLFGDKFGGLIAGKTYRSRFAEGGRYEAMPCRKDEEVKAEKGELAVMMLTASFVYLAGSGHIALKLGQTEHIFGLIKRQAAFVGRRSDDDSLPEPAFEGKVLAVFPKTVQYTAKDLVKLALGDLSVDPWSSVINDAKMYMVEAGYFEEVLGEGLAASLGIKKLVPLCDKMAGKMAVWEQEADKLVGMVSGFKASNPELYEKVWDDMGQGCREMIQQEEDL
jgi:hypothetical protein